MVTASRRTGAEIEALFKDRLASVAGEFWDGSGDNPYLAILALSDRLVVGADSVSMISEALATSAGVEVFGPEGGRRQGAFVGGLIKQGLARRFDGEPIPPPPRAPIDATGQAVQAVRAMLAARTGASG